MKGSLLLWALFYPLKTRNPETSTLAKGEDQDEMPHIAAFHQGLHCLLRQNQSSEKKNIIFWEIITYDPTIYTIDHPDFSVS